VDSIVSTIRDETSPLPGMHCDRNAPAYAPACRRKGALRLHAGALRLAVHVGALWATTTMRGKFGSEFET